jgi:hypothetical protein
MTSLKHTLLVLSLIFLVESKKVIGNLRSGRELKTSKTSKKGGGTGLVGDGNFAGGYFYDRNGKFISGPQLIEPDNKPCIPFDDARRWITETYPSDSQCRVESGAMTSTGACCRVYYFTDLNGPQKWLKYDSFNEFVNLRVSKLLTVYCCAYNRSTSNLIFFQCVCNENTAIPIGDITDGGDAIDSGNNTTDGGDRGGDNTTDGGPIDIGDGALDGGIDMDGVCSPANIGAVQTQLQESQYLTACQHSDTCGEGTCCFNQYCVCWPIRHLAGGLNGCA